MCVWKLNTDPWTLHLSMFTHSAWNEVLVQQVKPATLSWSLPNDELRIEKKLEPKQCDRLKAIAID